MSTSAERMRRLRERRRAELEAVPAQDASGNGPSLADAVRESLAALQLGPSDAAVSALALRLAVTIDDAPSAAVLRALGPLLLKCLVALRATPASRPGVSGRPAPGRSWVADLRAENQARKRRA